MMAQSAQHWDLAYERGETSRSWFEHEPAQSLRMIDAVGISPQSIIDIGGGSSRLADALEQQAKAHPPPNPMSAATSPRPTSVASIAAVTDARLPRFNIAATSRPSRPCGRPS